MSEFVRAYQNVDTGYSCALAIHVVYTLWLVLGLRFLSYESNWAEMGLYSSLKLVVYINVQIATL